MDHRQPTRKLVQPKLVMLMDTILKASDSLVASLPKESPGVRRLGVYRNKNAQAALKMAQSPGGLVVDNSLRRLFEHQGFSFNTETDNRSIADIPELFVQLGRFAASRFNTLPEGDPLWQQAVDLTFKAFSPYDDQKKFKPLKMDELVIMDAIKMDKASSAPEFTKKGEAFVKDFARAKNLLSRLENHKPSDKEIKPQPCFAYRRTQFGEEKPKTRLVFGYPQSITIIESRFAVPLIDQFLVDRTRPMAIGYSTMEISAKMAKLHNQGVVYSLDYSKFDSSISPRLISLAFRILGKWFDMDDEEQRAWNFAQNYFIHTPIIMPDGHVWKKHSGVPSGSYFTQLVDSVVSFLTINYISLKLTGKSAKNTLVLGDDGVFNLDSWYGLEEMSLIAKEIGININAEKSSRHRSYENVHFLGYEWVRGLPSRKLRQLVQQLIFPEKPFDRKIGKYEMQMIRAVGLVSSCVDAWPILRTVSRYKGGMMPAMAGPSFLVRGQEVVTTGKQRVAAMSSSRSIRFGGNLYLMTGLFTS